MEPEKFENRIKKVLGEREIAPSAAGWEKLEQRLEKKKKSGPYMLWFTSAAAIAAIFFVLGSYFTAPITSEEPQLVEQTPEQPVMEEKSVEPEVIQLAVSEANEKEKEKEKPSAERGVKNVIFGTPVSKSSQTRNTIASVEPANSLKMENKPSAAVNNTGVNETEIHKRTSEVSDLEVEALLLLATAELKSDPAYTVKADDLLNQVEFELEQTFRQKVFEIVKEGLVKAKTAVANRDF